MVAQLCEYAENYSVYFKWVNYTIYEFYQESCHKKNNNIASPAFV